MKKSVIKRRKRVVPAAQGTQASGIDVASNSMGSPESDRQSPTVDNIPEHRGTVNPDGSVNLGFRLRNERALLPEPISTSRAQNGQQQLATSDLTAYASNFNTQSQSSQHLESLNNENRLPPMTSYPSPIPRRPSLSPNSFLSPSRKRSFSSTEMKARDELPPLSEPTPSAQPKRLSSIKSILNPGVSDSEASNVDPSLRLAQISGPGRYPGVGSPMGNGYATNQANSAVGSAPSSGRDAQSESERAKLERREMLQREAEKMREALKAKERELAELGEGE